MTSEFNSDAMASRGRLFHAKVAEDDADIEAVASELDSDAMDSISFRFDAMIATDDLDIEAIDAMA
jgi:hypothetical protein